MPKFSRMISGNDSRKDRKSVSEYYSKLKSLWDELELYLDLPACTCDAGAQIAAQKEKGKVHQFLIGLNPDFSTIRSQILSMDPLPNVNKAHSMAAHDEAQRLIAQRRESHSEMMGFAAKVAIDSGGSNPNFGPNRGDFKPRGRPFCDFCGRNGHHRASCYQLHGYPTSDQANQRSSRGYSSGQSQMRGGGGSFGSSSVQQMRGGGIGFGSSNSGQSGKFYSGGSSQTRSAQMSRGQWKPNQTAQHNQSAQLFSSQNSTGHMAGQAQAHSEQADLNKLAHLSEAQLQQLVSLVSRDDGEAHRLSGENFMHIASQLDWIIDSGASCHMTGSLDSLSDIVPINDGPIIHVPNGTTKATFVGKDRTSGSTIGVGKLHGGVWLLRQVSSSLQKAQAMKADTEDIWHNRLGHPSYRIKFENNSIFMHKSDNNALCDVCC
ncbi:hypothetical protein CRG98_041566 [Punica granatum]|uniref:CCHC-type domain-containing protein n=1 Tax=Punica granatum TaxID=22663 RepID=A0A2I0I3L4_PUNGR|nr:hypothetical protein CRG98_041566 [Punica granatum]